MKTKLLTLFLALVTSIGSILAESGTCGENLTWNLTDSVLTISGTGAMRDYTSTGPWYSYRSQIVSAIINDSVTSIGNNAFNRCSALASVTIPNSVTSIGERAFLFCESLTSVEIPNSVTSIGERAFAICTSLTSIAVKNENTVYDSRDNCNAIIETASNTLIVGCKNTTIPNSVTSIGGGAFYCCSGLISLAIPNNVTSIEDKAFYGCTALTSVTIPSSVTSIEDSAFEGCSGLLSVTIPNSVTSIRSRAFYGCSGLHKIHFNGTIKDWCTKNWNPSTVSSAYVLYIGDEELVECIIPNSVTNISAHAFDGCGGLKSITIPSSVRSIGESAFRGCGLRSIIWNIRNYPDCSVTSTPFYSSNSNDLRSQITTFIIGDDVEHIPAYLCNGMSNLENLSIGKSVQSIGDYAFAGLNNRKINALVLPNSLTTIGDYAFSGDSYVESIYFGSSLENIGQYAFKDCSRVGTMTCLANVTPNVCTKGMESINSNAILYVPTSCIQKYKVDENWNRFVIEPLGTTDVLDPESGVTIVTGDNTATFTWPTNNSAELYKLVITQGGETVCTLLFNGSGQLVSIAFAPSKEGQAHAPSAEMTAAGMQFTITGLSYATRYNYSLTVKDGSSNLLASYTGSFGTTGAPQGIENVENSSVPQKILRNGQVLILRGDKIYTATGQEVR